MIKSIFVVERLKQLASVLGTRKHSLEQSDSGVRYLCVCVLKSQIPADGVTDVYEGVRERVGN